MDQHLALGTAIRVSCEPVSTRPTPGEDRRGERSGQPEHRKQASHRRSHGCCGWSTAPPTTQCNLRLRVWNDMHHHTTNFKHLYIYSTKQPYKLSYFIILTYPYRGRDQTTETVTRGDFHGSLLRFKRSQQRQIKRNKGLSVILKVELYSQRKFKEMLKDSKTEHQVVYM